jgi:hypothetical protein
MCMGETVSTQAARNMLEISEYQKTQGSHAFGLFKAARFATAIYGVAVADTLESGAERDYCTWAVAMERVV